VASRTPGYARDRTSSGDRGTASRRHRDSSTTSFIPEEPPPPYDSVIHDEPEASPGVDGDGRSATAAPLCSAVFGESGNESYARNDVSREDPPGVDRRADNVPVFANGQGRSLRFTRNPMSSGGDDSLNDHIYEDPLTLLRSTSMGLTGQPPVAASRNAGNPMIPVENHRSGVGSEVIRDGGVRWEGSGGCISVTPLGFPRSTSSTPHSQAQLQPDGPYHISTLFRESPNASYIPPQHHRNSDVSVPSLTAQRVPKIRLGTTSLHSRPDRRSRNNRLSGDFSSIPSEDSYPIFTTTDQPTCDQYPTMHFTSDAVPGSDRNNPTTMFDNHRNSVAAVHHPSGNRSDQTGSVGRMRSKHHRRNSQEPPRRRQSQRPSSHQRSAVSDITDQWPGADGYCGESRPQMSDDAWAVRKNNFSEPASRYPPEDLFESRHRMPLSYEDDPGFSVNAGFSRNHPERYIMPPNGGLELDVSGDSMSSTERVLGRPSYVDRLGQYRDRGEGRVSTDSQGNASVTPLVRYADSCDGDVDEYLNPTCV